MTNFSKNLLPFCFLSSLSAFSPIHDDEITVSAAASLRDVLTKIGADFQKTHPQKRVRFNFGSSGALQKQIEAGAPVDLFICAAAKNMDALAKKGEINSATRRILARGELVLIAPRGSKLKSIRDLRFPSVKTLALGGPGVPAGDYARQTLRYLRLESAMQTKLIFSKDVRAVLAQVAAGNTDAGFVYRTDALTSKSIKIVAVAPPQSHAPIHYPLAIVKTAPNPTGARAFWTYLQRPVAIQSLKKFGFK
jgi:molybdate transport system substrate-binding protein